MGVYLEKSNTLTEFLIKYTSYFIAIIFLQTWATHWPLSGVGAVGVGGVGSGGVVSGGVGSGGVVSGGVGSG